MSVLLTFLYGCETPADSTRPQSTRTASDRTQTGLSSGTEPVSTLVDARPAALVNGRTIKWGDLRPILNEAAGALALREFMLDRAVNAAIADAGITLSEQDIAAEQSLLLNVLGDEDDADRAIRLLDELRDQQNLGPQRFHALLRRNAGLRALVREQIVITEPAIAAMHDVLHGPRRQVRLITVPNLADAQQARDRVSRGESFGEVAVELSTDASASRGGILEPISEFDPSYPPAIRQAIWSLDHPGELSDPILLDDGYAIVELVREVAGDDVALDDARPRLMQLVRTNLERQAMDRLARNMLRNASVTIFDDSLRDSWERAQRGRAGASP